MESSCKPKLKSNQTNTLDYSRLGTGSADGPCVLMEGVRGQHGHHNEQNYDKEENNFTVITNIRCAATCGSTKANVFCQSRLGKI